MPEITELIPQSAHKTRENTAYMRKGLNFSVVSEEVVEKPEKKIEKGVDTTKKQG